MEGGTSKRFGTLTMLNDHVRAFVRPGLLQCPRGPHIF